MTAFKSMNGNAYMPTARSLAGGDTQVSYMKEKSTL